MQTSTDEQHHDAELRDHDRRITRIETTLAHLATKEDLSRLETSLVREFGNFKAEIRVAMANRDRQLLFWLVGTMVAASSVAFMVARFLAVPGVAM